MVGWEHIPNAGYSAGQWWAEHYTALHYHAVAADSGKAGQASNTEWLP